MQMAGRQIPQPDVAVTVSAGQQLSTRTERHSSHAGRNGRSGLPPIGHRIGEPSGGHGDGAEDEQADNQRVPALRRATEHPIAEAGDVVHGLALREPSGHHPPLPQVTASLNAIEHCALIASRGIEAVTAATAALDLRTRHWSSGPRRHITVASRRST